MDDTKITLNITYHKDQESVFDSLFRYIVVRCGRRWGKTKGAIHNLIECCLAEVIQVLWIDTTQANIEKYYNEHVEPILKTLPRHAYKWNKQNKILTFAHGSVVHFGSAEVPQNLEGFGYHRMYLNEAGIILKGESGEKLWYNTLAPMTMEHKCKVFFIGTPKGVGLFKEFSERGQSDDPKWKDWADFHYSSYDNPTIDNREIDLVCEGLPPSAVQQEIFATFLEDDEGEPICPYDLVKDAFDRTNQADRGFPVIWGVDPAQGGDDPAGLVKRQGNTLVELSKTKHVAKGHDGAVQGANWVHKEFLETDIEDRPEKIMVDIIGLGMGWYAELKKLGLPVVQVNVSEKSWDKTKWERMRDELWCKLAEWLQNGSIARDRALFREVIKPLIDKDYSSKSGGIKIESKEKQKKRLGSKEGASPNRADAMILTFAYGMATRRNKPVSSFSSRYQFTEATWMSA